MYQAHPDPDRRLAALGARGLAGVELAKATGARVTGLFVAPPPTPLVFDASCRSATCTPDEHAALIERAARALPGRDREAAARPPACPARRAP